MNAEIRQINYELLTLLNFTAFHIVFITLTRKRRYWKEPRKISVRTAYLPTEIRTRSLPTCEVQVLVAAPRRTDWTCIANCQKAKQDRHYA